MSDDGSARMVWHGTPSRFFRGLRARIVASVTILTAGFVFTLLYLGFLATRYAWYENVAVVLSVAVVVPVALVVMWVLWGLGHARRAAEEFWP